MMTDKNIIIFFDGNCNFCIENVLKIKNFFKIQGLELKNAHADSKRKEEMLEHNSWIIVDRAGKSHYRYEGFLILMSMSERFKKFSPFFSFPISRFIGDTIYKHITRNRGISK